MAVRESFGGLPPGFLPGHMLPDGRRSQAGRDGYGVSPDYVDNHHRRYAMPVKPEYDIVQGVQLLGRPRVTFHNASAASPRNETLPTVTQLSDPSFYRDRILPTLTDPHEPDGQQSLVHGPVEITPYGTNAFIFPALVVDFTQPRQSIGAPVDRLEVVDAIPSAVSNGQIDLTTSASHFDGLGYVTHVRVPVNWRSHFNSPGELKAASDGLPEEKARPLFEKYFREPLEDIGAQVAEVREQPVRGVLLSPMVPQMRMADNITRLSYSPQGELIVAASYLV